MNAAPQPRPERFAAIDGLRGVAVLLVLLIHLWVGAGQPLMGGSEFSHYLLRPVFQFGPQAVRLFFALSGFCLFYPVIKRETYRLSASDFFARRASRILPAFWVCLGLGLLTYRGDDLVWQLVTHLTFTHSLFPSAHMAYNGVLWSLGTEAHFYLLFPLLAWFMYRKPVTTALACLAVAGATQALAFGIMVDADNMASLHRVIAQSLPGSAFDFACGMFAAHALVKYPLVSRRKALTLTMACLGWIAVEAYMPLPRKLWLFVWPAFAPAWGTIIYLSVSGAYGVRRPLSIRPLVCLGIISYSVYLYNDLIFIVPQRLFGLSPGSAVWWAAATASVLGAGVVGYYVAEKPFLALRARYRSRPAIPEPQPPEESPRGDDEASATTPA
jgi:peptidoglycan/LPS O-acetylase OafA/YrhL